MRLRFSLPALFVGILIIALTAGAVLPHVLFAQSTDDRRAQLQSQLNQLESEIAENQAMVDKLASQGKSLSTEVATLNAQIKKAQLQVQATQVAIKQIDSNISVHQRTITSLSTKLSNEKESLAQILRRTEEIDNMSLVELAFSADDISKLFGDLDSYAFVKQSLGDSYEVITGTKLQAEAEKDELEEQRKQQIEAWYKTTQPTEFERLLDAAGFDPEKRTKVLRDYVTNRANPMIPMQGMDESGNRTVTFIPRNGAPSTPDVPQQAVEALLRGEGTDAQFDEAFGAGAATRARGAGLGQPNFR
jgi:type II secretory pathway pseudopilin PulG